MCCWRVVQGGGGALLRVVSFSPPAVIPAVCYRIIVAVLLPQRCALPAGHTGPYDLELAAQSCGIEGWVLVPPDVKDTRARKCLPLQHTLHLVSE